jgi:hypothetical protein
MKYGERKFRWHQQVQINFRRRNAAIRSNIVEIHHLLATDLKDALYKNNTQRFGSYLIFYFWRDSP